MKKRSIFTCISLAFTLGSLFAVHAEENKPVDLYVDEACVEKAGVLVDNKTYVPLRLLSEKMGCEVDWDGNTKTATVAYNNKNIAFTSGSEDSIILDSKMYIPIRKATESLNIAIEWEPNTKSVRVNLPKAEMPQNNENMTFETKLLNMMPKDKNIMVSPLSLKYALAMVANGADDKTKAEITNTLGIEDLSAFNDQVKAYTEDLKEYNEFSNSILNIANSVWINESKTENPKLNSEYEKVIKDKYDGKVALVNNSNAVNEINSWCDEKTNHKINKIVNDSDFKMLLANAVYFKSRWSNEFLKELTYKDDFTSYNGNVSQVDYLKGTAHYGYYSDDNLQVVCLPYVSKSAMYVAMPKNKDMVYNIEDYIDKCKYVNVDLSMPKFKIESSLKLKDTLEEMGMKSAFNIVGKSYPNILDSEEELILSEVLQNTFVSVDEEGTEAAAVTAVTMVGSMAMPDEPIKVKIDKPFDFYIVDKMDGFVLFEGSYLYAE